MNKKLLNIFAGFLVLSWVFVVSPTTVRADFEEDCIDQDFRDIGRCFWHGIIGVPKVKTPTISIPNPIEAISNAINNLIKNNPVQNIDLTGPVAVVDQNKPSQQGADQTAQPATPSKVWISNYSDFRNVQELSLENLADGYEYAWEFHSNKIIHVKFIWADGRTEDTPCEGAPGVCSLKYKGLKLRITNSTNSGTEPEAETPADGTENKKTVKTIMVAGRFLKDVTGENPVTLNLKDSKTAPITITYSDGSQDFKVLNFEVKPGEKTQKEYDGISQISVSNYDDRHYPKARDNNPGDEGSSNLLVQGDSLFSGQEFLWKLPTDRDQKYIYIMRMPQRDYLFSSETEIMNVDYGQSIDITAVKN